MFEQGLTVLGLSRALLLFLTTDQAVDRATLAKSSSQASLDFPLNTYYFICHYRQILDLAIVRPTLKSSVHDKSR
jgi:hypothetical protein